MVKITPQELRKLLKTIKHTPRSIDDGVQYYTLSIDPRFLYKKYPIDLLEGKLFTMECQWEMDQYKQRNKLHGLCPAINILRPEEYYLIHPK